MQNRILLRPTNSLRMETKEGSSQALLPSAGARKGQSACRDAEAGYGPLRYLTEPCIHREGLLLPPGWELLDGRPQVLVLAAHALPPCDRYHHIVQTPALPDMTQI